MSPRFLTCLVSTFHSIILHPICGLRTRIPFLRFFHLSALISIFCSTINVTSLFFVFSLFFFPVESPHKSLLPLSILLLLPSFILLSVLLPLSFFSSLFFFLLLLSSLLFSSVYLRHSDTSPSTLYCLSRPPPFPFRSSFFLVLSSLLSFFTRRRPRKKQGAPNSGKTK